MCKTRMDFGQSMLGGAHMVKTREDSVMGGVSLNSGSLRNTKGGNSSNNLLQPVQCHGGSSSFGHFSQPHWNWKRDHSSADRSKSCWLTLVNHMGKG